MFLKIERKRKNFKYSLFDINRYTEEELYSVANLVSAVFLLDQEMKEEEEVDFMVSNLGKTLEKLEKNNKKRPRKRNNTRNRKEGERNSYKGYKNWNE